MQVNKNMFQNLTLVQLTELIRKLNESGKDVHIEGVGNGQIRVVMEYIEIQ